MVCLRKLSTTLRSLPLPHLQAPSLEDALNAICYDLCNRWMRRADALCASQGAELPRHANPFALVTAAHLTALRTRADVDRRLAAKR